MKRVPGALAICGFLAASFLAAPMSAAKPTGHQSPYVKAAQKKARKAKKKNVKAAKAAAHKRAKKVAN